MLNKVMLIGNLGRDPEMRRTASGQAVANFSVATSRKWKDRDGNRQEQTEWHNIVAWGRQAEVAGQYLGKGSRVYVEGRLQTRSWDDRNTGEKKYRTEIVMDRLQMLSSREESRPQGYGHSAEESRMGDGSTHPAEGADYDDDIPFMLPVGFGMLGLGAWAYEAVVSLSQMVA